MTEGADRPAERPLARTRRAVGSWLLAIAAWLGPGARPRAACAAGTGNSPAGILRIASIGASAFPLDEAFVVPDGTPFFERDDGRLVHVAPRGGKLPETTYRDDRSLLFVPSGFRPREPAALVLFFHGNLATLDRDVAKRQRVPAQVARSGGNFLLVAPQFAIDALDSSAGNFWTPGYLDHYLDKAADALAPGARLSAAEVRRLPVVIVAYSGGYLPAAFCLEYALEPGRRAIAGVILLDALFGEEKKFADWIGAEHARGFFVSLYAKDSSALNARLAQDVGAIGVRHSLPDDVGPGTIVFQAASNAVHIDFVTMAARRDPLADLLARIDLSRL